MRKIIKQNSRFNQIIILGGVGLTLFGCTGLGGLFAIAGALLISGALIAEAITTYLTFLVLQSDQE
ncbi:hypothetical protein [uncultured Gimesia sp.]|uniref:hypothetical protein n=1 Tax=uncultured Gimesia sp. TaxID=1678688 RepID=UPI0030DD0894